MACLTLILFVMAQLSAQSGLKHLLPSMVNGWHASDDKYYDPESLYDYINGGAELYISYGFKEVLSRTFTNADGEEIQVEIFDMQNPENAYGVFSQQREEEETQFGQGSQVVLGSIIFWKDRYFVSMMNHNETPEVKKGMREIAASIGSRIKNEGEKPDIIQYLPKDNLDPASIRFFKHYIWLNAYYYIAEENYFNIDKQTGAVLAKYNTGDPRTIMLLIEYPNKDETNAAWGSINEKIEGVTTGDSYLLFQMDGKNVSGLIQSGRFIAGIFNAPDEGTVHQLLMKTVNNINP